MSNAAKPAKKWTAKAIRAEERRRREMPVENWMAHVGFSPEQLDTLKAESAARLAAMGIK